MDEEVVNLKKNFEFTTLSNSEILLILSPILSSDNFGSQLNLFSSEGNLLGKSLGLRTEQELNNMVNALIENEPIPELLGVGASNEISRASLSMSTNEISQNSIKPRSHA